MLSDIAAEVVLTVPVLQRGERLESQRQVLQGVCGMISMTNLDDRAPPAVGVYWIKEEDYPTLLKLFGDGDKMPRTWKEWLTIAEEMEGGLKAYGHVVMRVHIDPNTFARPAAPR